MAHCLQSTEIGSLGLSEEQLLKRNEISSLLEVKIKGRRKQTCCSYVHEKDPTRMVSLEMVGRFCIFPSRVWPE